MSWRERLREKALELGFSQLGVAPAEPPSQGEAFSAWLEAGHHADMAWLAKEPARRLDPRAYWPELRSLVAVSVGYGGGEEASVGPLEGRVARYARGLDYHEVLKAGLRQLGQWVASERPGVQWRAVVDTSPVLERAHAVRAGLGWFGKNAMLLSQRHGSYTLLGFLLLDQEVEPDEPVPPRCGSCQRCLQACPTGAILAPGVVDSRRCLSWATIERRGEIPLPLRSRLEGWLFGCDRCQEVCPWVRKAGDQAEGPLADALAPVPGRGVVSLAEVLRDDVAGFAARWKGGPVKRARRVGLARTAATLLGSSPDREGAVALLVEALAHDEPLVREHAAWALGEQGGSRARGALEAARPGMPAAVVDEALGKG